MGTGGGMEAPRRVSGAGSGYAPDPIVQNVLEAGSSVPENRYTHPVKNGGPFTNGEAPDT